MICPVCKQDAPTIARGMRAYCTACGAPRPLLSDTPVNVAGKPARLGGIAASLLGMMILIGGLLLALGVGAFFLWLIPASLAGWVLGGIFALLSALVGLPLVIGGQKLRQSGEERAKNAHEQAIFALASRQRGLMTARDVARALSISETEADALLTELAKRPDGRVGLEIEEDGTLRYVVNEFRPSARIAGDAERPRVRVTDAGRSHEAESEAAAEAEGADLVVRRMSR